MKTATLVIAAAALCACAELGVGGRRLSRSPDVPAAEGVVRFKNVGRDDTGIDLRVQHLTEPEELLPPGYAYVAWVQKTREDPPQNLGALNLDPQLDGKLRAVTPLRRFELFVTVEATSDAAQPSGTRLLWASRE